MPRRGRRQHATSSAPRRVPACRADSSSLERGRSAGITADADQKVVPHRSPLASARRPALRFEKVGRNKNRVRLLLLFGPDWPFRRGRVQVEGFRMPADMDIQGPSTWQIYNLDGRHLGEAVLPANFCPHSTIRDTGSSASAGTGPRRRHERFRRPCRLVPLASVGGGPKDRTFHALRKRTFPLAPDKTAPPS